MVSVGDLDLDSIDRKYNLDNAPASRLIMALTAELRLARRQLHAVEAAERSRRPAVKFGDAYLDNCPQLSTRTRNALLRARIGTVHELAKRTDAQLLDLRSFGIGSLKEVHDLLDEYGMR